MENLRLHTFRVENYKSIKHIEFGVDTLSKKIIQVRGDIGSSKSSLFEGMNIALAGKDGIPNTTHLEDGFVAEVCLMNGDSPIYLGAKIHTAKSGVKSFNSYIYSKDENGRKTDVMFGGQKATTKQLHEALTTSITFNMDKLFSSNQTEHKKIITKLFSDDLAKLGVDEIVDKISDLKTQKDRCRAICEANGSFRVSFEKEGYKPDDLAMIEYTDIDAINKEIIEAEIEKDRLINDAENAIELAKQKFENEKQKRLSLIKDSASKVIDKIRDLNTQREAHNKVNKELAHENIETKRLIDEEELKLTQFLNNSSVLSGDDQGRMFEVFEEAKKDILSKLKEPAPILDILPIENNRPVTGSSIPKEYESLLNQRSKYLQEWSEVSQEELTEVGKKEVDTKDIDLKIDKLNTKLRSANENNRLKERFDQWQQWMEAKGLHERELDNLAKLYAGIKTGVKGLFIVPEISESGKVSLWLKYNGEYDTEFFKNKDKELRYISGTMGYSESQRGIIGLMLQAARLDSKQQTLRLAILDSIPLHTESGLEMVKKVQDEFDLQIVISRTDDTYDKEDIQEGHIIMENGEAFFNQKK